MKWNHILILFLLQVKQKNYPSEGSAQLVKQYGAKREILFDRRPEFSQFCMEARLCFGLILNTVWAGSDGNETALATSRQTPVLCFAVRLGPGLQSLVRKYLRVTAACSAKSHFILLMDRWTDGCWVKAVLSGRSYGASEWWIALFLLSPNHHRSKPYFSGQKPSNIKTHNQVKLLAV